MINSCKPKIFDLNTDVPRVLVLGNGLVHSVSWDDVLEQFAQESLKNVPSKEIPYTLRATLTTHTADEQRYSQYQKVFAQQYPYKSFPLLDELLTVPFDAVLTTNYTYEIENSLMYGYSDLSDVKKRKYAYCTDREKETRQMLRTFNRFDTNGVSQDVWHIHGEARRKSSVVLTHDEYARLINHILAYNKSRGDAYRKYADTVEFRSWVDYFVLGELHIVGLGFDFAEFDLWWLLNRRRREKGQIGNVYFYEMAEPDGSYSLKQSALRQIGVKVEHCDTVRSDINDCFDRFYTGAIKKIKSYLSHT